ncbi:MAG: putative drug exporter of the superfamily [Micromonosporaceae bacterium]|nr:putative drug exporter of the superfamily [Micromonosporaceae bacterium]
MVAGAVARIGRWCFRHRGWVLAGWVGVVVLGALAAGPVVDSLGNGETPKNAESTQARTVVEDAGGTGGVVIGVADRIDPASPAVAAAVGRAAADLSGRTDVRRVDTPYSAGPESADQYLSGDRQAAAVAVTLAELDQKERDRAIDAVTDRLHRLAADLRAAGQPRARVRVGGEPAVNRAAVAAEEHDLGLGEELSLPLTLIALVLIFGGLVAAGLPVLGAVVSIASSMLMLLGFTTVTKLDTNVLTVVTLLGLGLSIDYGLLLVNRYREELSAGWPPAEALGRAWASAGRTVLFSALTVAAALSGLLMFDLPGLSALGAAGVSVAVVAMLVALTFTASLIGFTQRRLTPRARVLRRAAGTGSAGGGFFAGTARLVQRRPVVVTVGTTALLLVAAAPVLGISTMLPGLAQMPASIESVAVSTELGSRFALGDTRAVTVVARADPATLDVWASRWASDRAVRDVRPARTAAPGLSSVDLDVAGPPTPAIQDLVTRVRADRPPGVASWVTGDAARLVDLKELLARGMPWAVGIAVLAMLVLLVAMTGSVVVPLKAIAANVLSLAATVGIMTVIFVHGWLSGPLHTLTVPGLDPFVTVIIVAFAFGLSMDYEVFLLSRIKEQVDAGVDSQEAVRRGLQSSGRIITSAALLMMIVFACFGGARMGAIEELGIGLTVAVLIDATIVRCLLVPATMTLLGRWNWWSPAPLRALLTRAAPVPPVAPFRTPVA